MHSTKNDFIPDSFTVSYTNETKESVSVECERDLQAERLYRMSKSHMMFVYYHGYVRVDMGITIRTTSPIVFSFVFPELGKKDFSLKLLYNPRIQKHNYKVDGTQWTLFVQPLEKDVIRINHVSMVLKPGTALYEKSQHNIELKRKLDAHKDSSAYMGFVVKETQSSTSTLH